MSLASHARWHWPRHAVLALVLLHGLGTVTLAVRTNVWIDEAYTLHTASEGPLVAWRRAMEFELQPPLYFVLISLLRSLSSSVLLARLFSVACVLGTLVVGVRLSRRYLADLDPTWLTLMLATNPFLIWAAVEIRCYALVMLLGALSLLFLYDGYLAREPKSNAAWWHVCVAAAGIYVHYYFGFLLVGEALGLLALGRLGQLRRYVISMAVVALLISPLLPRIPAQIRDHSSVAVDPDRSIVTSVKAVYWRVTEYPLPVAQDSPWRNALRDLKKWLCRLAVVAGLVVLVRRRRDTATILLASVLVVLVVAFTGIRFGMGEELFSSRHTATMVMPLILFALVMAAAWGSRLVLASSVAILLLFNGLACSAQFDEPLKQGDWQRVARHLTDLERPNEPILVFTNDNLIALELYYQGQNRLVPLPSPPELEVYDLRSRVLNNAGEVRSTLASIPGKFDHFWIVISGDHPFCGIDPKRHVLERFLSTQCKLVRQTKFHGAWVKYLEWNRD